MICSNHTQILSYAFVCLASHGHADDIWARQASSPRRALFVYTNTPHQMTSLLHRGLLQSRLDCTLGKKRAGAGKREKITLSPCFRFLSPALPSRFFFLRSSCGGESQVTLGLRGKPLQIMRGMTFLPWVTSLRFWNTICARGKSNGVQRS